MAQTYRRLAEVVEEKRGMEVGGARGGAWVASATSLQTERLDCAHRAAGHWMPQRTVLFYGQVVERAHRLAALLPQAPLLRRRSLVALRPLQVAGALQDEALACGSILLEAQQAAQQAAERMPDGPGKDAAMRVAVTALLPVLLLTGPVRGAARAGGLAAEVSSGSWGRPAAPAPQLPFCDPPDTESRPVLADARLEV